ncbi:putative reductase RutE in pyrimidine catabolism pathway [Paramagnetospirillum magnetotacticum MS-1]|uniref:Putative NADH dehydrogenase/NAD(P)H nitroreductase CCC_01095 n=1 Tax=Paramagnetospirillum magnetotacticum MS-1 TaxID=272627 RepID=A0A0C2YEA4_PARME|nr:malonic semialdehyde reductase [Paramagnetospirillum magnetotacticum]KIL98034.1 putative reductase RutE in pyrimidine catabolism pathway [Paramagnetospirillum magnetotacticum MS-1]
MSGDLDQATMDRLFAKARTYSKFTKAPVSDDLLRQAWDLARMGPTSVNCQPMRVVFVRSSAAKERLKPALAPGNLDKTMAAPVTAIIAHDMEFYEQLPKLFPHADARAWFVGNEAMIQSTAFRNGTLQGAYFILALRAIGLDCGPMSGFDNAKLDEAFFKGTTLRSNFLVNIGHGDAAGLYPRGPRLDFDEACRVE